MAPPKKKITQKKTVPDKENQKENIPLKSGITKKTTKKAVTFGENTTKIFEREERNEEIEIVQKGPITVPVNSIFHLQIKEKQDTRQMNSTQLKTALKSRGLPTTGTKKELIIRLEKELLSEGYQHEPNEEDLSLTLQGEKRHTRLSSLDNDPDFQDLFDHDSAAFKPCPPVTFSNSQMVAKQYKRKAK